MGKQPRRVPTKRQRAVLAMNTIQNKNTPGKKVYLYDCIKCEFKTDDSLVFKKHAKSHFMKMLRCNECHFETNRPEVYDIHLTSHGQTRSFCCTKCNYRTNLESLLESHVCDIICPKCSLVCESKEDLEKHSLVHLKAFEKSETSPEERVKMFKCYRCDFESRSKGSLKLHSTLHLNNSFTCSHCDYVTNFENLMEMHRQSHHNESIPQLRCLKCPYATNKATSYKEHMLTHDNIRKTPVKDSGAAEIKPNTESYICPKCNFKSNEMIAFKTHLDSHGDIDRSVYTAYNLKRFNCQYCNYSTDVSRAYSIHLSKLHKPVVSIEKSENSPPGKHSPHSTLNKNLGYISTKRKKYMMWPTEEKKEIYWCHIYSKHPIFEKLGASERRRKILAKRGILDPKKLKISPDTRFHSIITNMKMFKTKITKEELKEIEVDVERHINNLIKTNPDEISNL